MININVNTYIILKVATTAIIITNEEDNTVFSKAGLSTVEMVINITHD